jgi:predicted AAA+ superfamily ATPase
MASAPRSPIGRIVPRHAQAAIEEALADTRVVLVTGARQVGKSTIVAQVAQAHGAEWRTLDNAAARQAARADPVTFVRSDRMLVIDEVQRVPELLLAIKEAVDANPAPGQFLLTGSARVLALRGVPDALPGRVDDIELWPFSQGEIEATTPAGLEHADTFVDRVFDLGPDFRHGSPLGRDDVIARVARGGYPEAVARSQSATARRRERFLDNYLSDLINRDVIQLSEIEHGHRMRSLIRLLADRSGQLLVPGRLASDLGLPQSTVERYLSLLEQVFLIHRIPAWSRNLSGRATKIAKVIFTDSGLAANVLGQDEHSLSRIDSPLGHLLEGFVDSEVARQLTWSRTRAELSHYRTKDKVEVDAVLEDRAGRAVAIEVKAAATVRAEDFRGIDHLAARLGDDLIVGIVLYTGRQTLPFGPKKLAVPVGALWEGETGRPE